MMYMVTVLGLTGAPAPAQLPAGGGRDGPLVVLGVQPGDDLSFGAADYASSAELIPGGLGICIAYPNVFAPIDNHTFTGALSFALAGSTLIDGAACKVFQYHEFKVIAEPGTEGTPVRAQISGNLAVAGILALLNMGSVNVLFAVDVVDVTDYADPTDPSLGNARMITSHALFTESLASASNLNIGFGVSIDAGSATGAQIGIVPNLGLGVPIQVQRINKSTGFGFDVILQRDHTYRVVTYAQGTLTAGPGGGAGAAVFFDPLAAIPFEKEDVPDLLSPNFWLTTITGGTDLDLSLPTVDLGALADELPAVTIPQVSLPWPLAFNKIANFLEDVCNSLNPLGDCGSIDDFPTSTELLSQTDLIDFSALLTDLLASVGDEDGDGQNTSNDLLSKLGLPTDFTAIVNDLLGVTEDTFGDFSEWIPDGGAFLPG